MPPHHVAVLGGGLTGLSAAFHLNRRFPSSLISVFESSDRFGGWVKSSRVDVRDNSGREARILVEGGPRTLRPNSDAVMELIHLLNLLPALIHTPKTSPSAKNRFLYLSPSPTSTLPSGIVQLPSSFLSLLGSSVGRRLLLPAAAQEPFRWGNRPRDTAGHTVEDESFDAFCTRRFGPQFASTMASALVHGIYAADSRKLSVRAAFPSLWNAEQRGGGSVVRGMLVGMLGHTSTKESVLPYQLGNVKETLRDASVFSFRNGIEDITQALVAHLKRQANVRLHTEADIRSIAYDKSSSGFEIKLQAGYDTSSESASHLVSALPLPALRSIMHNTVVPLPTPVSEASSVTVCNLIFPPTPSPIHPPGFGYLIPRPEDGYESAPHGMLGVVFDSCSLSAQDESHAGFTKMTVMLGGPYPAWTREATIENILNNLSQQLGVSLPPPVYVSRRPQLGCIPIPGPGHLQRVQDMRRALSERWEGRFDIIGAGVGGVSVGDCVRQGREAGREWQ